MSCNKITSEILKKQEERLTNAEKIGDLVVLNELLSDDFAGLNLHGQSIDKKAFISNTSNSDILFDRLEISELTFKLIDAVGIVIGKTYYQATLKGKQIDGYTRFMNVWLVHNDRTLLVSSTVIHAESFEL